jgi:hypothetical protein
VKLAELDEEFKVFTVAKKTEQGRVECPAKYT